MPVKPLTTDALYNRCDPSQFNFHSTADIEPLTELIGQTRALDSLQFGIGIQHHGYNVFALGPAGIGKQSAIHKLLEQQAGSLPPPSDWCYINNFKDSHKPRALRLPAGWGPLLKRDMQRLIEELRTALAAVFNSEEYRSRVREIEQEFDEQEKGAIADIQRQADEYGIALIRTPGGFAFAPKHDDEVINPDDYKRLNDADKKEIETHVSELQDRLRATLQKIPQWRRQGQDKLNELRQQVGWDAIHQVTESIKKAYESLPEVVDYLHEVEHDVVDHVDDFQQREGDNTAAFAPLPNQDEALFRRYRINVIVTAEQNAPVVYEDNPTYQNLIGRIEHQAMMGALLTDFTLIKAGALHRANNGYLILDAAKVLSHPYAWEGLKRALRSRQIHVENLEQMLSLVSTISLEPEPISLNVKVVLFGDRFLYYLLCQLDPEFSELFKVQADFEDDMPRTEPNNQLYARFIATYIQREAMLPFARDATARVIEHGARLAGDSEKLSLHMRKLTDLLCEADYWARQNGSEIVHPEDVQRAIDAQAYRAGRVRERLLENIRRDTIHINTEGEVTGQVNGLVIIQLDEHAFGVPTRITARIRLGEGQVLDIEREVELGGPIHSKGVLILSGFLGARYAPDRPLSLSASLVFEQSYAGIEGDSASAAELYALLSALADVPVRQSWAVTGSVDQLGRIQAIGGVNEKIEGFFDACREKGLSGDQGVLIPVSNVKDLMLKQEVIDAVAREQFHIYAVDTIDQGIEILTGIPAGERTPQGNFPQGTLNYRVERRLKKYATIRHLYGEQHVPRLKDGQS